jgi:catechol 2,3-dioxygenase-like lactoylglutathione lyase family enzyme
MIEGISAVTLVPTKAFRFYRALGFEVLHGGEESSFTGFRAAASYLNLIAQPAERRWSWWGRVIFYVADVDALYDRALAAGYQPTTAPRDAEWGERFFHLIDPDGHELSFAAFAPGFCQIALEAACHSKRHWERVWCSDIR